MTADGIRVLTYIQAGEKADDWFVGTEQDALRRAGGEVPQQGPYTVADAIRDYLADAQKRRMKGYSITQTTAIAYILPELGEIEVSRLYKRRIEDWHSAIAESGRRKTGKKRDEPEHHEAPTDEDAKRARKDSANRILTVLKAALNLALQEGRVQGPAP